MICGKCGTEKTRESKGKEALPNGWKRHDGQVRCPDCWRDSYSLRAISIPVSYPLDSDWDRLRSALKADWAAATNASNWIMTRLFTSDVSRKPGDEKMPAFERVYLYPEIRQRFPALAPRTVASLEQAVNGKYRAKRYEVVWTSAASLPTFRYPTPLPVHNQGWSVRVEDERAIVSCEIGPGVRVELMLKGGARYARQIAAVRAMASGVAQRGELALYPQKIDGEEAIVCKMVAWLPKRERAGLSGTLFVRTSPEALMVAFDSEGNRLWALHWDHLRRWKAEHAYRLQRLSYDQKMEERYPASFQSRREGYAEKYSDRMKSSVQEAVSQITGYVARYRFAEVVYSDADHSWCPGFQWFALAERLKIKLGELGVGFTHDTSPVPGESELAAAVKLNRKDKKEKKWLRKTRELEQFVRKLPEAPRSPIAV